MIENLFVFVIGTVFGSFYNVVIYRMPRDISFIKGRSTCPYCGVVLQPLDLVPVLSQLLLMGKCRYCNAKISLRYPCIEIITGILFIISYLQNGFTFTFLYYTVFWSMLLIVAMIDYDHMIIMDAILLFFGSFAFIYIIVAKMPLKAHLSGAVLGFAIYFAIFFISRLIYKEEAFGLGDIYLMAAIGLYLGALKSLLTAFMSFFVALAGIIIMAVIGKKLHAREALPFGPYMCIAAFIASLFGDKLINLYFSIAF